MWKKSGSGRLWHTSEGLIRHGFRRADGYYFSGVLKNGEHWLSPETWQRRVVQHRRALRALHERRLKDPQFRAQYLRERAHWRQTHVAFYLWLSAKTRAKRNGIKFNLVASDVVVPKRCPVLGLLLKPHHGGRPAAESPSLDRINPRKGYVKGNILVVSWLANRIKTNATPDEVLAVGRFYKNLASDVT